MIERLGAALGVGDLVLIPPLHKPGAVRLQLVDEVFIGRLAGMLRVLGAETGDHVVGGAPAARVIPGVAGVDEQHPEQRAPLRGQVLRRPNSADAAPFQARMRVIGPSR